MKRKVFTVLCVLALVLLPLVASAAMYGLYRGYPIANVYVDGNKVTSDVPTLVIDGRTMVPLRFVSDALGAGVAWDGSTQSARITAAKPAVATEKDLYYTQQSAVTAIKFVEPVLLETTLNPTTENRLRLLYGIYIMENCQKRLNQPIQEELHSMRMDALHWMELWMGNFWCKWDIWRANEEGRYQEALNIASAMQKTASYRQDYIKNSISLTWLDQNIIRLEQQYGFPPKMDIDVEEQAFLDWIDRNMSRIGKL